jgi:hypothetical protein
MSKSIVVRSFAGAYRGLLQPSKILMNGSRFAASMMAAVLTWEVRAGAEAALQGRDGYP